jgi:2-octaprenyl-6-methoxyphenol hydroxylase
MLADVVIVGAGPVGATLALALADSGLEVVVLDARAAGETLRSDRSLALSHGARLIFERVGVWSALAADPGAVTPITRIDISQAGGFGAMHLAAEEQGVPALGYVVSYRALQAALDRALARSGIAVRHRMIAVAVGGTPAYAAVTLEDVAADPVLGRIAAVADGTGASVAGIERRRHDYGQVALIAKVWTSAPHAGLAYERFTPEGPIALLPEGDHYGLVWTATPERAKALQAENDDAFLAELARRFANRSASFTRVAERRSFPLAMEYAAVPAAGRCIVVGNAAQTLHPVAGQGFNLGLRDAWELAQIVVDRPREAIGDRAMLSRYLAARRTDRLAGIALTHGLVGIFGNDHALLSWPRGLALTLLGAVPVAKRAFTRAMLFGMR